MAENDIVGLSFGYGQDGEVQWLQGFGHANINENIMVDAESTEFRWASMSKQVTSILSYKLNERGKLDLNADISKYWQKYQRPNYFVIKCNGQDFVEYDDYKYQCAANDFAYVEVEQDTIITQSMLLSHYAGIESYGDGTTNPVPPDSKKNDPRINDGIEWAMQYFMNAPFVSQPNSSYAYTTFGLNMAGVVCTYADAEYQGRYEDLARALVFERVYGNVGSIQPDFYWLEKYRPQRATGYKNPQQLSVDNDVSYKTPGGGYISNVKDALTFALNYRNETLLTNDQKSRAWTPYNEKINAYYGMGFQLWYQQDQLLSVGHDGSQDGARSMMRYYPQVDVAMVFMSNSENLNTSKLLKGIEKILWRNGVPLPENWNFQEDTEQVQFQRDIQI
ncbi:Beta-lactamase/transpeptidase-like protein [Pseudocohnilembus persalinus]|uniref:Beta-lactamase/transpeptidase-like protein n=1 Tax=Pseudocohnilembus persalinus TaxID=266149 RepID=A0A0V0Q978_PSEPJ|nr:Beta-lactamase/transpeptidase-like protein [Pseudocohnilembus persalinus]|eukprot:KRW98580.1 Beta-lactamase/transpeptidase-like protein [Pseudocohnilembus persalinus]